MAEYGLQVTLALAFIVVLIVVMGFAVRRLQGIRGNEGSGIDVLSSRYVGAKERLLLVEVEGRKVLIGMTPQCIAPLATIDGNRDFADVLNDTNAVAKVGGNP